MGDFPLAPSSRTDGLSYRTGTGQLGQKGLQCRGFRDSWAGVPASFTDRPQERERLCVVVFESSDQGEVPTPSLTRRTSVTSTCGDLWKRD